MVRLGNNNVHGEISLFMLLFLHQLLFPLLQVNSYVPLENFAVNCGDNENYIFQDRNWTGDVDTVVFFIIEPKTGQKSVEADALKSRLVDRIPFGSARLSHSKFTYSFPVTSGPKFLRLHFYPTSYANFYAISYGNFSSNNSLFSVIANNFTLLKDFNASLWLVKDDDTITKEYCINVESGGRLNVTFLPNTNHSDAYAFINGIEVVSMPSFLYYTDPNEILDPNKFKLVGLGDQDTAYTISIDKALERLYRVNVGDKKVPPSEDTGMFRNWDNDYPRYLVKQFPQSVQSDFTRQLTYKNNVAPNYTAPASVYLSARSYGKYATEEYNVTWEFEVDSEFTYMARLHFCEFDNHIEYFGDRAFQIFIADNLAEQLADVIGWSGGRLVPVYRDYAVLMSTKGRSQKLNLSIKLQRLPNDMSTKYRDVILNGIEIFKISDENNNLAAPKLQSLLSATQSSKNSKTTIVIIAVVAVSGLMIASVIGIIVFRRKRRTRDTDENSSNTRTKGEGSSLQSPLCRYFSITELKAATNNFNDGFIIGVGGFGNVYKGYIDGDTPVAIKRLKSGSQQGAKEFMNEIKMLSELRHDNLVSLVGYCNDGTEMILVYNFMQRGTLREYLYNSDNQPLSWKQRLEILLDAARGLQYLHKGAKYRIIHRDVKSTNILLDENWVAKVSDLGLSKVGPSGISRTHVTTMVKGSIGYLDPEYHKSQRLTLKSDVYSFGVVLLEVLCARPPFFRSLEMQKENLVDWFRRFYDQEEINQTVDPFIKDSITEDCLKCYSQMALSCLLDDGNQRPSMSNVIKALEFAMQLVEGMEDNNKFGGVQEEGNRVQRAQFPHFMSDDEHFSSSDESWFKTSKGNLVSASNLTN